MPRYFLSFDFAEETIADPDGGEASDLEAARDDARAAIREIAAQYLKAGIQLTLISITICDSDDRELAKVTAGEALD